MSKIGGGGGSALRMHYCMQVRQERYVALRDLKHAPEKWLILPCAQPVEGQGTGTKCLVDMSTGGVSGLSWTPTPAACGGISAKRVEISLVVFRHI